MNNLENKLGLENVAETLKFTIENESFYSKDQYKTGLELKQLAGIPADTELYLQIKEPWQDELIDNNTRINLARPEIEHFFVKKKLHFTINKQPFVWYTQYIKGSKIRELGKIAQEDEIYLDIEEDWVDDQILDDEIVDLARPGKENFFSKKAGIEIVLIVNGRDKQWNKKTISFDEVIILKDGNNGNGNKAYTVTYSDGPKENQSGEMAKGEVVFVKNKMKFYATATDKS